MRWPKIWRMKMAVEICPICNAKFWQTGTNQTCGTEACKLEYRKRLGTAAKTKYSEETRKPKKDDGK